MPEARDTASTPSTLPAHSVSLHPQPTHPVDKSAGHPEPGMYVEKCLNAGLIDVHSLDSTILTDLKYASEDNFLNMNLYGQVQNCFLQPEAAQMLVRAQKILKSKHPGLTLLVWDAARPLSVQKVMWRKVKPPPGISKGLLVSNPLRGGSLHNYGCAVDVTIADENGKPLDMGSEFDCFGEIAWPVSEQKLLKDAKLTPGQVTNRKLLRSVMYGAGFWNIQTEWWHFNAMRRETAIARYPVIP